VLRTAGELFRRQGYHGTGLNQVVAEGQAPKGSLYFHFPAGKEQLATESIDLLGGELRQAIGAVLSAAPDPRAAMLRAAALLGQALEGSGFRDGCPVAVMALEAAADSEPIRAACDGAYDSWLEVIGGYLRSAGVAEDEAGPLADFVLSSIEGALLLARVRRDVGVLRAVAERLGAIVSAAALNRRERA